MATFNDNFVLLGSTDLSMKFFYLFILFQCDNNNVIFSFRYISMTYR